TWGTAISSNKRRRLSPSKGTRGVGRTAFSGTPGSGVAEQRRFLHLVTDDLATVRVSDRLASAEAAGRASRAVELFLRGDSLQAYAAVGIPHETLSAERRASRSPPTVPGLPQKKRNDFAVRVHGR